MGEKAKGAQKMKYGFWLRSDVNQLIEDHKHLKNDDRSAFVTEAIRRYCAELDGERNLDVLCDRMYKIISAEADAHSNRIASLVFKIAVEMAIQNKLLGAGDVALTEEEMCEFCLLRKTLIPSTKQTKILFCGVSVKASAVNKFSRHNSAI